MALCSDPFLITVYKWSSVCDTKERNGCDNEVPYPSP
jgi:hypothetical protein